MRVLTWIPLTLSLFLSTRAVAAMVELVPSETAIFAVGDTTGVALLFNLGGLASRTDLQVDEAILDWELPALETGGRFEFQVRENDGAWSRDAPVSIAGIPLTSTGSDMWEFEGADLERIGRGLVRLDITKIARGWINQGNANNGVVVYSKDVSVEDISSRVGSARLVIRYGRHP